MSPLRRYREKYGMTQADLAAFLEVSLSLVQHIEYRRRSITPRRALEWHDKTRGELRLEDMRPDLWGARHHAFSDRPAGIAIAA